MILTVETRLVPPNILSRLPMELYVGVTIATISEILQLMEH